MNDVKPSHIVLLASGAVTFLFSFMAWIGGFGRNFSAWNGDIGFSPLSVWPALLGLAVAGLVAAMAFGNVTLPERILTLTWPQIFFIAGLSATLIQIGFLLSVETGGGFGFKFGFWLMTLGSLGLVAGAVMEITGAGNTTGGSSTGQSGQQPPTPF